MTTINNSENLIEKVGGIEKAREIIAGAPSNAVIYWHIAKGKFGVYSAGEQNKSDRQIILDDLRTAIAEHDTTDIGTEIDSFLDAFKSPELTDDRKQELTQDWKGMSGGVAFSLIERHADNWKEIDYMMNQWLEANKEAELHG